MSVRRSIAIIAGPTASGKTALACALAEKLNAEVISADSQQVYRGLDVGTAKPSPEERARARHHLVDIAWPEEQLDVAQFVAKADAAIAEVNSRGKLALVVGGTGLWIRALVQGLVEAPGRDDAFRARFRERVEKEGLPELFAELQVIDPKAARRILPGDRTRIERAIEVYLKCGRTLSSLQREHQFAERRYRARVILLDPPRPLLWKRVEERTRRFFSTEDRVDRTRTDRVDLTPSSSPTPTPTTEAPLANEPPLVRETRWLRERIEQIPPARKALAIIGYGETSSAIDQGLGELSLEQAREKIAVRTRQYAKRQRTWFKKDAPLLDETKSPLSWPPGSGEIPGPIDEGRALDALCSSLREWYESAQ